MQVELKRRGRNSKTQTKHCVDTILSESKSHWPLKRHQSRVDVQESVIALPVVWRCVCVRGLSGVNTSAIDRSVQEGAMMWGVCVCVCVCPPQRPHGPSGTGHKTQSLKLTPVHRLRDSDHTESCLIVSTIRVCVWVWGGGTYILSCPAPTLRVSRGMTGDGGTAGEISAWTETENIWNILYSNSHFIIFLDSIFMI